MFKSLKSKFYIPACAGRPASCMRRHARFQFRAQSLLEVLLAIALSVILIGGSVGLIGVSLRIFNNAKQYLQANSLMRQT
ncbi:MAG: type IV pilus modification PilV family protein, partial [Minisyncoccia bacterium]